MHSVTTVAVLSARSCREAGRDETAGKVPPMLLLHGQHEHAEGGGVAAQVAVMRLGAGTRRLREVVSDSPTRVGTTATLCGGVGRARLG